MVRFKKFRLLLLSFVFYALNPFNIAQAQEAHPVIVELYTSQSCSSCPPADKIFGALTQNPNVIGVSCHVDYWNHLHWKDTLSLKACTDRQRQRARYIEQGRTYTPNLVINGRESMVGSKSAKIMSAINTSTAQNAFFKFPLAYNKETETLRIDYPEIQNSKRYSVTYFAITDSYHQEIPSGENRGRSITYHNVARDVVVLPTWNGTAKTESTVRALPEGTDSLLLLANDVETGAIAGYGYLRL